MTVPRCHCAERSDEAISIQVFYKEVSFEITTVSIDPELLKRLLEVSGERTKRAAVTKALEEFVARREQKRLLDLMNSLEWDQDFDYKAERSRLPQTSRPGESRDPPVGFADG